MANKNNFWGLDFGILFQSTETIIKDIQKSIEVLYYLALMNQVIQEIKDLMEELLFSLLHMNHINFLQKI